MLTAKQTADLITWGRSALALALAAVGLVWPAGSLPLAVGLMLLDWTGDNLDGFFARRGPVGAHSWIGDHDLEVDMLVSLGLLVYLTGAGWLNVLWAGLYLLGWAIVFWRLGLQRPLGMLFQAPIYAWFIGVALIWATPAGIWIPVWVLALILITWPKFPREVVPGFLRGMRRVWSEARRRR